MALAEHVVVFAPVGHRRPITDSANSVTTNDGAGEPAAVDHPQRIQKRRFAA